MAVPAIHPAHALLRRAHSPDTASTLFQDRASQKPLPLRPSSPDLSARASRRKYKDQKKALAKRRSTLKPRPLSAAQTRKLCIYEIPAEQRKYSIYEPLHNLWLGYIREILGLSEKGNGSAYITPSGAGPLLASADMHGALLEVVRSKCVSRVGLRGIVVRDSKFVFDIITKKNEIKSIPKEHTIFQTQIPFPVQEQDRTPTPLVFEILGESFQNRAPDRVNKKFKMHYQPWL
ncbi:ribonuclease-like protein P complex subunit Pop4 [Delitschia confertaspora ATCC 74209]|uniref:Ribonuclease P protein subunit n=1 Tax=Delitschia confertaspora ATCC 74209 TaxID=1513339 RepID=A0A9P4JNK2_9PLEO|nr:ribonuclease-like protein P complex subunit Pop4 [Delitschia confertaspora ATCC 74209]